MSVNLLSEDFVERKPSKQNGLKENCRGRLAAIISKGLKPIPPGTFDLHAILNDFPVDLNKVNDSVNSDPDFGQRVLRLCNAVLHRCDQWAPSIADAAVLLGPILFHAAVILCAVTEFDCPAFRDQNAEFLWSHSLHIGVLSEEIARHTEYPSHGMAFLGGLLHDIGYLPLLQVVREQENPARELAEIPWQGNLDLERDIFGLDHCIVGRWMANSWEFSPSLVDAIWHHHDPGNAEQDRHLAEIVCAAKYHCADSPPQ
jgi:putative nucleotidyltransferase with HDIG domain